MSNRDGFFAMVALALGAVALAGVLYTDAYSHGARIGFGSGESHLVMAAADSEGKE